MEYRRFGTKEFIFKFYRVVSTVAINNTGIDLFTHIPKLLIEKQIVCWGELRSRINIIPTCIIIRVKFCLNIVNSANANPKLKRNLY